MDETALSGAALASFERARPALTGLAYRMLGSGAEAEDCVQDVYLAWAEADHAAIRSPEAWLKRACANRCIDIARKRSRIRYVGDWLPEPPPEGLAMDGLAADGAEAPASLYTAFLLVVRSLPPKERAAFLLRDVLDEDYEMIAATLDVTPVYARQLATRARRRLAAAPAEQPISRARTQQLFAAFETAIKEGDTAQFAAMMNHDVILSVDSGGKVPAILERLSGQGAVLAFLLRARQWWPGYRWEQVRRGAHDVLLLWSDDAPVAAIWFGSADSTRLSAIYIVREPQKLARIAAGGRLAAL